MKIIGGSINVERKYRTTNVWMRREGRWSVIGSSYVVVCRVPTPARALRFDVLHAGDEGKVAAW